MHFDPTKFSSRRSDLVPQSRVAFRIGPADLADDFNHLALFEFDLPKRLFDRTELRPDPGLGPISSDLADAFVNDLQSRFGNQAEAPFERANRAPASRVVAVNFDRISGFEILRFIVHLSGPTVYACTVAQHQRLIWKFKPRVGCLRGDLSEI